MDGQDAGLKNILVVPRQGIRARKGDLSKRIQSLSRITGDEKIFEFDHSGLGCCTIIRLMQEE
jgi:hypothetical protein